MNSCAKRCVIIAVFLSGLLRAQFSSGSNGSDGALNYTTAGTYSFNPTALGLNPAGDNIFNFTTINIASGVTLQFQASLLRSKPVIFLASGNVIINGTLSLNGAAGADISGVDWMSNRVPSEPGPGGYPGGVGALLTVPNEPGGGPGAAVLPATGCAFGIPSYGTSGIPLGGYVGTPLTDVYGAIYGGPYLIPLLGGSGGSGGCLQGNSVNQTPTSAGGNGGAGGGAIQIVSSTSITVGGSITANGGGQGAGRYPGGAGSPGSGGAIYLVAPTVGVTGTLSTASGTVTGYGSLAAALGRILLSGNTVTTTTATLTGASYTRPLFNPPLPTTVPAVQLTSIGGVAVPANPQGVFQVPDVVINTTTSVPINIAAQNIPLGTVVNLYIQSATAADQTVVCTPLAGTAASSTASCAAAFPTNTSTLQVRAIW